ncbi:N-glycosylase/DNA lyase [Candidatus Ruminimicrobium bovinum]|uniref:N-glycosylase/DNA lyase n=1 Tax=Candidatus Ruminimicrobium bovinum TaxID=3242779 RepID=UPI0039B846F6
MLIKIDFVNIENTAKKPENIKELVYFWNKYAKEKIEERIKHFRKVFEKGSDNAVFAELAFCLFTPQSKAVSCWKAVNTLYDKKLLFKANCDEIAKNINNVRFQNNKAKFLVQARDKFSLNGKLNIKNKLKSFDDIKELRKWIIDNIKGIGYKEAGHFLRNIGLGLDLAILDRHILKNLKYYGAIDEIPETLTVRKYLETEQMMVGFCNKIKIPMAHIDLLFWAMQTGGIFK